MPQISNKRRMFLANPQFQISFMAHIVGSAAVVIAVFYGANLYFFWKFVKKGKEVGLSPDHIFFKFLAEQQRAMDYIFLGTGIITFVFLTIYGYFFSNRVAGALYRLEAHFRGLAETGVYKDLKFRKGDYFRDIAEAVNKFAKQLFEKK